MKGAQLRIQGLAESFEQGPLQALQGSSSLWDFSEINRLDRNESTHLSFEDEGIDTA
jgi:hypothetical protein